MKISDASCWVFWLVAEGCSKYGDFRKSRLRPSTKFEVCRPSRSEDTAHLVCQLSIYKIVIFTYPGLIFLFALRTPMAITQNVAWMKRRFNAYQTPRNMYPSIFNSFPVIRTASAKNRRFHVLQPTFLFSLETPLRLPRNMLHGWKDNSMLAKPLAACTYQSSIVSELYDA